MSDKKIAVPWAVVFLKLIFKTFCAVTAYYITLWIIGKFDWQILVAVYVAYGTFWKSTLKFDVGGVSI